MHAEVTPTSSPVRLTPGEMEARRLLAAEDLQGGMLASKVAEKYGVSRESVSQWKKKLAEKRTQALIQGIHPGRPSRLTAENKQLLRVVAQAMGKKLTGAEFANLIFQLFGIRYHEDSAYRVMVSLGICHPKPRKS